VIMTSDGLSHQQSPTNFVNHAQMRVSPREQLKHSTSAPLGGAQWAVALVAPVKNKTKTVASSSHARKPLWELTLHTFKKTSPISVQLCTANYAPNDGM